jgi:hypothetical protein
MITTPYPLDLDILRIGQSGSERAAGVHASDLYGSLYKELMPERYGRDGLPPPLLLETGLVFENMLEEGFARRFEAAGGEQIIRPGEFTHRDVWDGYEIVIHFNPDLLIYNGVTRLGEIKATWMSSPPDDDLSADKFQKYFTQIKFYLKMLRLLHARLYVFFVCGNYKPPTRPMFKAWDLEFTQDELDMEYAMLCYHGIHKGLFSLASKEGI